MSAIRQRSLPGTLAAEPSRSAIMCDIEHLNVVADRAARQKVLSAGRAESMPSCAARMDEIARRANDAIFGQRAFRRVAVPRRDREVADVFGRELGGGPIGVCGKQPVANETSERLLRRADPEPPAIAPVVEPHAVSRQDDQRTQRVERSCSRADVVKRTSRPTRPLGTDLRKASSKFSASGASSLQPENSR